MTSVTGQITQDNIQIDGRHTVTEIWTDDLGNQYTFDYMADKDTDVTAKMNARYDDVLQMAINQQAS